MVGVTLSRVALERMIFRRWTTDIENESYFPTYSQALERYLREEFSKVLLSNVFPAF